MITLSVLLFGAVLASCAQEVRNDQIPSVVSNTFMSKFPTATDIEWKVKDSLYKVDFEIKDVDYKAYIDMNGQLVKYKEEIRKADIPDAVKASIKKLYAGYRIDDAEKIVMYGKEYYRIELESKLEDKKVLFAPDGLVILEKIDLD